MGTDGRGYWSLYLSFIDTLGSLRYRGIPLALVANFYQYLSPEVLAGLRAAERNRSEADESRIQSEIERRITGLLKTAGRKKRSRRAALCPTVLRFPESVYVEYFHPDKSVILADYAARQVHGLPVHSLRTDARDCADRVEMLVRGARRLFARLTAHPELADADLQNRFLADIPEMVRLIDRADRYMRDNPPAIVVLGTTELMLPRVLALTARRRGVPTICLQHGLIVTEEAYMPVFADVTGVYGPADLDWYARRGVRRSRLAVVGHPRFDVHRTSPGMPAAELVARLGFEPWERLVLIATQPHVADDQLELLVKLLARDRNIRIVLKPHPLEERSGKAHRHIALAGAFANVTLLPRGMQLQDVLRHMDAVIVESSTVGLEALLAGCDLLIMKGDYSAIYERWGLPAFGPEQLALRVAEWPVGKASGGSAGTPAQQLLKQWYPRRLSAPVLADWIRRLGGVDCRPRISWLRDGMLLKSEGPAIYLIQNGMRRRITGPKQLRRLMGKQKCPIQLIKPDLLKRIPQGEPFR